MSQARINKMPKVLWQGVIPRDVQDIQQLLEDFVVTTGHNEDTMQLAVILHNEDGSSQPPIVLELGDTIILDRDEAWVPEDAKADRIGVLKGNPADL